MTERVTASGAMKKAEEAMRDISEHERICALRYEAINEGQKRAEQSLKNIADLIEKQKDAQSQKFDGVYNRIWWIAAGGVGAVLTLIGLIFALK